MNPKKDIDRLLRSQQFDTDCTDSDIIYQYAKGLALIENCLVVISDLKSNSSRIFNGGFANELGLSGASYENSIWEGEIIGKICRDDQEEKYLSELRFFNFLRKIPHNKRKHYYLVSHLRFIGKNDNLIDVMHRMYYWYEGKTDTIRYGVCIYSPFSISIPYKSVAINSVSGEIIELTSTTDSSILSKREKQILSLIETGLTSQVIADRLCISKHTVSRHRQEILSKLQARNSTEACKRGKLLKLI